ncbi:MAG: hypothetical protein ACLUOI_40130, partial [Eisenbergiella sp.]
VIVTIIIIYQNFPIFKQKTRIFLLFPTPFKTFTLFDFYGKIPQISYTIYRFYIIIILTQIHYSCLYTLSASNAENQSDGSLCVYSLNCIQIPQPGNSLCCTAKHALEYNKTILFAGR